MHIFHSSPAGLSPVLLCSPSETIRATLSAILAGGGWTIHQATNHSETIACLEKYDIPVVIVDGRWREILEFTGTLPGRPSVIVTVPFADEAMLAEVLNLGGYDVLSQPLDANEVTRIANAGLRRSQAPDFHPFPTHSLAKAAF